MKWVEKLRDIDRRIIFLVIGIAVAVPLLLAKPFPEYPTPMAKSLFRTVDALPDGSRVLMAFDYDPASDPELQPMATAWMRQCVEKRLKIVIVSLWPIGQDMARKTIEEVKSDLRQRREETGEIVPFEYGEDYVNLGFKSGGQGVINVMLTNIENMFPTDVTNKALRTLPIMRNVKNLRDFALIINISAGTPGLKEWVQFGSDPAGVPIVGGCTAVQAPLLYPYYPRQLSGLLGGLKPAAEYEKLLGDRYPRFARISLCRGRIRMSAQAVAHVVIMAFIIIGNLTYFLERRRRSAGS